VRDLHPDLELCREIEAFIQQLEGLEIEVRPAPNVKRQVEIADDLADLIEEYKRTSANSDPIIARERDRLQKSAKVIHNAQITDTPAQVTEQMKAFVDLFLTEPVISPEANKAFAKKRDVALELRQTITDARTQGMIHEGEGVRDQLEQCQQENRKLSKQILEYKTKLHLP
jgi:hypothetical protein